MSISLATCQTLLKLTVSQVCPVWY